MSAASDTLRQRTRVYREDAARLTARVERISVARLAMTAVLVIVGAAAVAEARYRIPLALVAGMAVVVFVALVRASHRLDGRRRIALARAKVSEQGALRAERAWAEIDPQPWTWESDGDDALRADLDVLGRESLIQLLPTISRGLGAPLLHDWFATPGARSGDNGSCSPIPTIGELGDRQASVAELRDAIDLRDAFELCARRVWLDASQVEAFIEWGRGPRANQSAWLRATAFVLPGISIASIAASARWPAAASLAILSMFVTFVVVSVARRRFGEAVRAADAGAKFANAYAELAATVLGADLTAPRLIALQGHLRDADRALDRLNGLSTLAEVRASPMLHGALQALLAWDLHIARRVENWRALHGVAIEAWFAAFAEMECLCALGGLAYANEGWTFPVLSLPVPLRMHARELGHPLLHPDARVANDVEIGPPGSMLLISGSNMSGKSTLLRAIGLNVLLARVGGPVCATSMACPPMALLTSLRVQDSLADGMSYFMAEALRLRDIVFAAEQSGDGHPPVMFLVDEILRGTNSEERAVAARYVVARLLDSPAIGAITTHDLGVFDVAGLSGRLHHMHFAERFDGDGEGERLVFDYRLRPGPATSRNALRLLKLIGLSPT
jgi:hypothetical protein